MGMGTTTANNFLKLLFNATNWANIADNTATSPLTNLYLALHTADPGAGGAQNTSEVAYTSYARVAVARTSGGFTVTTNSVALAANQSFPQCTGGSATATYFSVGTASSGAGVILFSGPLAASLSISNNITPILTTGTTITET